MKTRLTTVSSILMSACFVLAACNKAEPPDKVQAEVDKAASEATANDAKADDARKQAEAQSTAEMVKAKADAQTQAVEKSISAVADQAVTEVEGQTNVALAKCKALEGDAQVQCKEQANAHLKEVKDRAKAVKTPPKQTDKTAN